MRKMLCLLLMLAMLTPCLPALAEDTDALDVILLSSASIEPLQETLRPGKAVTLRFTSPVDGTVTLLLRNSETLETVLPVAKDYPVTAGENQMLWNGTYEGVFAPEGIYRLVAQFSDGSEADTAILVGQIAPFLTSISALESTEDGEVRLSFYASENGRLTLGLWGASWSLLENIDISAGTNEVTVDATALSPDTVAISLTLTDDTGYCSNEEHVAVNPASFGILPTATPTAEPSPPPTASWNTPMDYTDEAAVWAMLTAPMTVVKGDGRTQVRIRKEPDSKSAAIGILTRATQGIRVIETLDNGWSLIECYSSSFADNTVKAWNLLVQGYVETNTLTTVEWDSNDKYGLVVDKLTQRLYVYEDGHLISTLLVSTGLANAKQPFNETRSGEYIIGSFTGEFTSGNLYCGMGLRYNDGDLLHEVPHTKRADGSKSYAYNEPKLGTRASHGCIRVQRLRNTEGLNMKWLWDNRKHLGRMVIWEDWQGRQIPIPDDDTVLYYNPNGGSYYHRADTCYSVTKDNVTFESFTYAQLDEEPYSKLDFCPYCAPAMRKADIEAINAQYVFGGDHDPILTAARQPYFDYIASLDPPEATETPAP